MKKLFGFVLLSSVVLSAWADSAEQKLSGMIGSVQSFTAQFQQTIQGGSNAKAQESSGEFQLQRPGKFRWETKKPYHQLLVSAGKELWIYEPDISSVTVNEVEEGLGSTPALLLSSSAQELAQSFTIEEVGDNQFKLLPKDKGSNFEEVMLVFKNKSLSELLLSDTLGNQTRVVFSAVKLNEKLPADRFQFTPPADADLIDNRKKKQP